MAHQLRSTRRVKQSRRTGTLQKKRQQGYASLTIGVVLLFMLSLVSIYLTKSGIVDLRTSANKVRYAEALAQAERRLEVGLGWMTLSTNRATLAPASWVTCDTLGAPFTSLGTAWRCRAYTSPAYSTGTGTQTDAFTLATPVDTSALGKIYYVIGQGTSADGSGSAVVRQGVFFYGSTSSLSNSPAMMGAGNVPLTGTFNLVGNPNAGGKGVPVSIWSKVSVSAPQGSAKSCQLGEYLRDGNCNSAPLSYKDVKGPDIIDNYAAFPSDMFSFLFGVPSSSYGAIKAQAQQVSACTGLDATTTGIVWATANCTISGTVGSPSAPVILVVETADFQMNANSTFYGVIFAFDPNGNAGDITANGGAKMFGVMLSNDTATMGVNINGTFDLVYSGSVVNQITTSTSTQFKPMAKIPGSWADYL